MHNFSKNFLDAIQSEECALFIGAGISTWSGLPTWDELITQMLEFLCDRGLGNTEKAEISRIISKGDLLTAASLCKSEMRPADFREFIHKVFVKPNPKPHEIHHIVVDLGPDSFVTTNYDHLIDDAYQVVHDGLSLLPVNNNQPIEQAGVMKHSSYRFIFALHGRIENCETIILTSEDYRRLRDISECAIGTLQHLLISRPVIYLGFGLRDPDFLMLKDKIAATYRGGEREHFAIMPDVSELQKRFLRQQYGINILSYDTQNTNNKTDNRNSTLRKHNDLLQLLKELHGILKDHPPYGAKLATPRGKTPPQPIIVRNSLIRYCEDIIHTSSIRRSHKFPMTASFRIDLTKDVDSRLYLKQKLPQFKRGTIPLSELLQQFDNLIIVGLSGSGKTHVVSSYATTVAEETLNMLRKTTQFEDEKLKRQIPLILNMKEYTGNIMEMIEARLPRSVNVKRALELGWLVLILDAINEVPRQLTETRVLDNNISWLMNLYPGNKFVFTSRSIDYLSFLTLPVFELQPLLIFTVNRYLQETYHTSVYELPVNIRDILTNPLFLTLMLHTKKENLALISNMADLLHNYFLTKQQDLIGEVGVTDFSLTSSFAPLAYEMIDYGVQTAAPERVLLHLRKILHSCCQPHLDEQYVFNALISRGVLVLSAEGEVGFFHQTVLEYLAALELARLYEKDPIVVDERVNLFRWDETIMLFISMITPEQSKAVLRKIAEIDLLLACKAFESSTFRESDIGLQLFDMICTRLSSPQISEAAKWDLAKAIKCIGVHGRKQVLAELLNDKILSKAASIVLAQMGAKEHIQSIIQLLLKDNVWPSEYSKALRLLADDSVIPQIIEHGKRLKVREEDFLISDNLAAVLSDLESEQLYAELCKLTQSDVSTDRQFAADILAGIHSDKSSEFLASMLSDSDHEVRWEAIFSLRGSFGRKPYKTAAIVSKMLELLSDKESGRWAVDYLIKFSSKAIIDNAIIQLRKPRSEIHRLNLCAIIAKSDPETSKRYLFDALNNYRPSFHDALCNALSTLGVEYIVPDIFVYLTSSNPKIRITVLEALRQTLGTQEQLSIDKKYCDILLNLWERSDDFMEKHIAGYLLPDHCSALSKAMLLERLSDPTYPHRDQIVELVARLPLGKNDLSIDVLTWLTTKLTNKYTVPWWSDVPTILGKVCDEIFLKQKLIPLLTSSNEFVRNNVYLAISQAEKVLGKRLIQK